MRQAQGRTFAEHCSLIVLYINGLQSLADTKRARVVFEPDPSLDALYIDGALLGQVVHNLVENAIQHSRGHTGIIHVAFHEDVKLSGYLLSVADNGRGIQRRDQGRVFERFYRADSSPDVHPEGTGLGLYLVKMVIEDLLGGRVWCTSTPGKGATFYAFIPKDAVHKLQ